jgi:hypothetical protein
MKIEALTISILVTVAVITALAFFTGFGRSIPPINAVVNVIERAAGQPSKRGSMDDVEFTKDDQRRVAEIAGRGFASDSGGNLSVISNMQAGLRSSITRRDFELMRQDIRRARAAYPDVALDDMTEGSWIHVDLSAHVPMEWGGGNANGTEEGGVTYLDGGAYQTFVKPEYTKRASAADTKAFYGEDRSVETKAWIRRLSKWGNSSSASGTGGWSQRVECYPDPMPSNQEADDVHIPGKCVVILGDTKYVFPFIVADWVKPKWRDGELKALALSRQAGVTPYVPAPAKSWVMKDGLLATGETCAPGRLCWSMWNGDGYDNKDIGPSDPASWVLESPFGLAYLPAPDNGEQRAEFKKPWYLVISYYGSPTQVSGGWSEAEAKAKLPEFQTGFSIGMQGQDVASLNQGNLREARATQIPPTSGAIVLADRGLPVAPPKRQDYQRCGSVIMPGETCMMQ